MLFKTHAFFLPKLMLVFCLAGSMAPAYAGNNLPDKPGIGTAEAPKAKIGIASWYSDKFHGRKTASGEIFSQKKLTCASNHYPLGTWLRITHVKNGKTVIVKVNDRMHPRMTNRRIVDLSRLAAQTIGIEKAGLGKVEVENLGTEIPQELSMNQ